MTSGPSRRRGLARAGAQGAFAGLLGVAAMTAVEQVELALTKRPRSYVPARTLLTLLGRSPSDAEQPVVWNHAMHWGTGAVLGCLRGVWSAVGIRGLSANAAHTVARLCTDQTLENATGVGAPPSTWPAQERLTDVGLKAVYSFVAGVVADALIPPALESRRGTVSH